MALQQAALEEAARGILAAAVAGADLQPALATFATAAGGHGALFVRQPVADRAFILETPSITEPVELYKAGKAPPDPRYRRVSQTMAEGFAGDQAFFSPDELARDAYYNEFLARYGLRWQASALLAGEGIGGLYVSVKRQAARGPYDPEELASLDRALPQLRAAALFAHKILDAAADRLAHAFETRQEGVFRIDGEGRVTGMNAAADAAAGRDIAILQGRITAAFPAEQARLDAALKAALAGRAGLLQLSSPDLRRRVLLLLVPVLGMARDLFGATSALAVLVDPARRIEPAPHLALALRDVFRLTPTEAEVAALVGVGQPLDAVARRLNIAPGTARLHLKSVFQKTGAARQTDLAVLLGRLQI